jgi:hypothetical protein
LPGTGLSQTVNGTNGQSNRYATLKWNAPVLRRTR